MVKCKVNRLGHCVACNNQITERAARRRKRLMLGGGFVAIGYRKKCGKCNHVDCICELPAQNLDDGNNKKLSL